MLGLNQMDSKISYNMITTAETLAGFDVLTTMSIVEGVAEDSFPAVNLGGVGIHKRGGLDRLDR
jgi:hypothetical protein